jgi:CDP-diacylglycerol---glycerol-3-phosphate 3-phosphatidyltransferase
MPLNLEDFFLRRLRIAVVVWILIWLAGFCVGIILLRQVSGQDNALKWAAVTSTLGILFFFTLWKDLPQNRTLTYTMLFPELGLANHITIFRGCLLAGLAGLVFIPIGNTRLEWIPGILYVLISLLDFADGAAARLSNGTTLLGEHLDMRLDGVTVLAGSLILVLTSRAPTAFLLVGLMRYLYLGGQWFLRKIHKPIQPLPASPYRRVLAGMVMGFISVGLFPVFSARVISVASIIFMVPFVVGFLQDFLYSIGVLSGDQGIKRPEGLLYDLYLLILRLAAGGMFAFSPVFPTDFSSFPRFMFVMMVAMGFFPRIGALGIMVFIGDYLTYSSPDSMYWAAFLLAGISFILGGGLFAFWSPEDRFLMRRIGDKE